MHELSASELAEIAAEAMIENGFAVGFPSQIIEEAAELSQRDIFADDRVRDLRGLLWSAIDDASSRDLDQVEYAERLADGSIRLLVGIADVDDFVRRNSPIDEHARQNTVSVYTQIRTFPLLPESLSTAATSLLNDVDRRAVVIETLISETGKIVESDVYPCVLRNYAKLSYEEIGAWLDDKAEIPARVKAVEGMKEQILLQLEAAQRLEKVRRENGALQFESLETSPVFADGKITGIKVLRTNSARLIIENFMISANVTIAEYLEKHNRISLRRIVKIPQRWDKIIEIAATYDFNLPETPDAVALADFLKIRRKAEPLRFPELSLSIVKLIGAGEYVVQNSSEDVGGHFGLAVRDYAHSTAPNRRFADIITQRLVKSVWQNTPAPYTQEELQTIAAHCNERLSAARKVERKMRKVIAASVLANKIGMEFEAVVTGVKPTATFARLLDPPADGRIVRGEKGLDVGEKVVVRLVTVEPRKGFIDFELTGK